jgi:predicted ATPase
VICCDDVQWSDLATRDLLLYRLGRQAEASAPQLLVLAVRTEALAGAPELEQWLSRLGRQAPTRWLKLGPLSDAETVQALDDLLAEPVAAGGAEQLPLGSWLYSQSEGQPFYLVELLRTMVDQGVLVPGQQADAPPGAGPRLALAPGVNQLPHLVPAGVHALIREQLRGLSVPAFELLAAAAVLGAEATFERLCLVADLDERAGLAALDELGRRGLLVEMAAEPAGGREEESSRPVAWRFAHEPVREVAYTEAGEARRRLFHRRALAALERSSAPATLAHHAQAAGLTEPSLHALVAAGDAALAVSAAADAQAHYEQARRLLAGPDGAEPPRRQDWGEAPAVSALHGRAEELATLAGWLREEHCQVVQVLGAGGTGKTALVTRLAHDLAG